MRKYGFFVIFCLSLPVVSYAIDVADLAGNASDAGFSLSKLLNLAAILVGTCLIAAAIAGYREHRRNPKFYPLDKTVFYFVIGIICVVLPFLGRIMGGTSNPNEPRYELKTRDYKLNPLDIDQPLN